MEKEFVPYELALKLKELGFDEPCIMYYDNLYGNFLKIGTDDTYWGDYTGFQKWNSMPNSPWKPFKPLVSAPLWQQAFDWFRKQYKMNPTITSYWQHDWVNFSYHYQYQLPDEYNSRAFELYESKPYRTYEEARLESLKKLIELCQTK